MDHPKASLSALHNELIGLMIQCPTLTGNPPGCHFHETRRLPLAERVRWIASLSADECLAQLRLRQGKCTRNCLGLVDIPSATACEL